MTDRRALARGPDRRQSDRRAPLLPGIILDVARDQTLHPRDVAVYLVLFEELDVEAYLPVKHAWVGKRVHRSREGVHRSIKRLLERGYLECEPIPLGTIRTYRLTSRMTGVIPKDLEAEALRDALREIAQIATDKAEGAKGKHKTDLVEVARQCVWTARHSEIREAAA